MKINEIIRKYRKEKNMTQEELAAKLGVTAPAVNKWESGASMPDITLLAPIARIFHISLDELLSFNENLSDVEISNIIKDIYSSLRKEDIDTIYQKITDIIREYPNEEKLILQLINMLNTNWLFQKTDSSKKYDDWIQSNYESLLSSNDELVRIGAIESLYAFFLTREHYEEAEKCLNFYSEQDPRKKRKLATIYYKTGQYDKAYKTLEEIIFADYQTMSTALYEIYMIAIETKNYKKAESFVEKISSFASLFEMGEYHKLACTLELAIAMKDTKKALDIMDSLLTNTNTLMDFQKSSLYEHMTFNEVEPNFTKMMISNQIKEYCEDDKYKSIREIPEWENFKTKWC